MQAFDYEALDTSGRPQKGMISADSARSARRELKRRGLAPLAVKETRQRTKNGAGTVATIRHSLGHKDRTLVTRQLATLVGAAAPIEQALNTIAGQADKDAVKHVLQSVRSDVLEGHRLADAMRRQPKAFSPLYVSMVAAGENAGSLPQVLERLADYMERTEAVRAKVQTALIYPACLAVVAVGVIIGLMTFVVPKVVQQFDTVGQTLPLLTRIMIAVSDFTAQWGLVLGLIFVAAAAAFIAALRKRPFRERVDRALLAVPFLGRMIRQMNAARFARTLGTLSASGVPIVSGLKAAEQTIENTVLQNAIGAIVADVTEGKGLSAAMRKTAVFPPMLVYMVAAGENSGTLADMLGKAASYMEAEFESVTNAALSLLEPAIIIVMGAVVATIVLAILMPILQLNALALG